MTHENTSKSHLFPTINKEVIPLANDKQLKRIATLDFFRGFAIFFMTVYHVLMMVYDYRWMEDFNNLIQLPTISLILMGLAAFFGTWHGFFLLISSIVNAYTVISKARKIEDTKPILFKQVFTGAAIYFLGWFEQAFGYMGYFGSVIQGGSWSDFSPLKAALFRTQTLQAIGLCLIVNGVILYFLTKNGGHKKFARNMRLFGLLIILTLILTVIFRQGILSYSFLKDELNGSLVDLTKIAIAEGSFKAWLLTATTGGLLPPFPFMVTSFAGSMIGLSLASENLHSKTPLVGIAAGLFLAIFGIILIVIGAPWTTIEDFAAMSIYFIRFGFQLVVVWLTLLLIEFRDRGEKFGNRAIVSFFRRWGIISLTIYIIQIFQYVPRLVLHLLLYPITGVNFIQDNAIGNGSEGFLVIVSLFTVCCFYLLIILWGKIRFIGSFEWLIIKAQSLITGPSKQRLDPKILLNNVTWISFAQNEEESSPQLTKVEPTKPIS